MSDWFICPQCLQDCASLQSALCPDCWDELQDYHGALGSQAQMDSLMEAFTNTAVGFWISVGANYLILPLFGYTPKFVDSIGIAALFTIVSIVRSYILRRLFNGRSVWAAIRGKR